MLLGTYLEDHNTKHSSSQDKYGQEPTAVKAVESDKKNQGGTDEL